jgi:hypothetical protein
MEHSAHSVAASVHGGLDMANKGSGLAARLRAAVEQDAEHRDAAEQERLQRLDVARRARAVLFDDLQAFGGELGFAEVARGPHGDPPVEAVTFRRGEHWLRFEAVGDEGEVRVDFGARDEKAMHRVYREPALEDRWIWVRRRRTREDRLPLFDQGLELLLVHALDLPSPDAPPVSAAPTVAGPAPSADSPADSTADPGVPDVPTAQKRSL